MATETKIVVNVDASGAGSELADLIALLDKLGSQGEEAGDAVDDLAGGLDKIDDTEPKKANTSINSLAVGAFKLNQVVQAAQTIWNSTFGAAAAAMNEAIAVARDMRSEFDPLVVSIAKVDNEFQELQGNIGDVGLISSSVIKESLLPAVEVLKTFVDKYKVQFVGMLTETAANLLEYSGFVIKAMGVPVISIGSSFFRLFNKITVGWGNLMGFLALGVQSLLKKMPFGDWAAQIKKLDGTMDALAASIKEDEVDIAAWRETALGAKVVIEEFGVEVGKAGARIRETSNDVAVANRAFGNLSTAELIQRLNDIVNSITSDVIPAFEKLGADLPLAERLVQLREFDSEIKTLGITISQMQPGSTSFDTALEKLQEFHDRLGIPLKLNLDSANPQQQLQLLQKAFKGVQRASSVSMTAASNDVSAVGVVAEETTAKLSGSVVDFSGVLGGLGNEIGSTFGAFTSGAADAQEASAQMGKAIIKAIASILMTYATQAVIGAGASQAAVPIVGPSLAVASMAAMSGIVMGLIDSIPTAADGGFVSGGRPNEDSVAALLMPGEYVMSKNEVKGTSDFLSRFEQATAGFSSIVQRGSAIGKSALPMQAPAEVSVGAAPGVVNVEFKSQQLPNRTETKRWVKDSVMPALNQLRKSGY